MKVKELLKMEIDVDVADDVCESLYIAFCGPIKLTPAGKREFADVLEYEVDVWEDGGCACVHVDGDDWKHKLKRAKELFYSLGGYCDDDLYKKWFRD